jgi:hypothetical protein
MTFPDFLWGLSANQFGTKDPELVFMHFFPFFWLYIIWIICQNFILKSIDLNFKVMGFIFEYYSKYNPMDNCI